MQAVSIIESDVSSPQQTYDISDEQPPLAHEPMKSLPIEETDDIALPSPQEVLRLELPESTEQFAEGKVE
jgi:hypothetical protein